MTFTYRHRKEIIFSLFLFFILTGGVIYLSFKPEKPNPKPKTKTIASITKKETKATEKTPLEYKVDIKGEIINPGIYSLSSNSRVIDVINQAGGLTENANTSVINLSKKIIDEMVIIIYSNSQVKDFEKTKELEKTVFTKCLQADENALKNDACITEDTTKEPTTQEKISLNTATKEQLMTLPNIGEAKAEDIIAYRTKNGNFTTIEDIMKVSGIGESIFAKIKENITL